MLPPLLGFMRVYHIYNKRERPKTYGRLSELQTQIWLMISIQINFMTHIRNKVIAEFFERGELGFLLQRLFTGNIF